MSLQLRNPITLSRLVKHILKILSIAFDIFLYKSDSAYRFVLFLNVMGLEGCHEVHTGPKCALQSRIDGGGVVMTMMMMIIII